jgi:hypothetical protein
MGRKTMLERLRRLLPGLLNSMSLWSWLGQVVVALPVYPDDEQDGAEPVTAVGPPPGHPERHAGDQPMTAEERALWANLEGTDR